MESSMTITVSVIPRMSSVVPLMACHRSARVVWRVEPATL